MRLIKSILVTTFFVMSALASAGTYSISKISLGYGKLDVSAGGGHLYVNVDEKNTITSLSINVTAGFFGANYPIKYSEKISSLTSGKSLDFYMDGGSSPVLKLQALSGFTGQGGKLKLSVLKNGGYASSTIEIWKGKLSNNYHLWNGNTLVDSININMRGYKIADMYVGWYELI
jgi:hypothetical protein